MAPSKTDRNLLFAVIALQLDILEQEQFAEACAVWALTMERPMDELLLDRGWISPDDRQEITHNLQRKLKKHRGDVHASLAAAADSSVREILRTINEPVVRQSVDELAPATGHVLATLIPDRGSQHTSIRYTLSRVHGEGGLGRVWLAHDTDLNRKVALKEVRIDRTADVRTLRRFLKEAQVTGQLEHPNIVPVYELGRRKEDDHPFYTMRFVEGRTLGQEIAEFHRDRAGKPASRLDWQRRLLEPFLKICEAIGYAHSRNVIHRDLKPENVVLGDHGEAIVLDWGLAKLLTEALGPHATVDADPIEVTDGALSDKTHGRAGTPVYMAPEQVAMNDDQIDTRTDLYGLGAILYEILANRPPAQGTTLEEIYQNVSAGRIPRAREVDLTVPAALDAICAKALSLNRHDRYASASALADEVRRWLIDEPVSVYRDPLTVRLTRWGRKHRTLVTSAAAVLLVAVASFAVFASERSAHASEMGRKNSELIRANTALDAQRRRAEDREAQAIAAVKQFGDVVANEPELKKNPALEALRKRLLKEPLAFFRALRDRLQADKATTPESLARLARASFDLGSLTNEIGDKQDALAAFQESQTIRQKLADDNPNVIKFQRDLALCRGNVAHLLRETGKPAEALQSLESALAIHRKLASDNPADTEIQSDLAKSHREIGLFLYWAGKPAEARQSLESALAIQQRLADENPTVTLFQGELAATHVNIGYVSPTGKGTEALQSYERGRAILQKLADDNPAVTGFQNQLANSHNSIGYVLLNAGKPAEALKSLESARAIYQKLADDNPSVTMFVDGLARSHVNIGVMLNESGKPAEALKSHESARKVLQKLADDNPSVAWFQEELATSHNSIGLCLRAIGKPAEALKSYESALLIWQKMARDHPESSFIQSDLGGILNNLAMIELDAKRFEQARDLLRQAIESQRKALAVNSADPNFRKPMDLQLNNLIKAYRGLNDAKGAAEAEQELANFRASDPAMVAMDARLAGILKGDQTPRNNSERLELAQRAYEVALHSSATQLWIEALTADPSLMDNRQAQHGYNAACAAALAGCGQGKDDPRPDDAAKAKLRRQAHDWLRRELAVWAKILDSGAADMKAQVAPTLQHWKEDTDLAGIRDEKELAKLPEDERAAFKRLWNDVDQLLTRANGSG
jgi:eukaryotic-like serine/threonine-protein kinase